MPIFQGVDVSYYQGTINFTTLKTEVSFAIIKATGGDGGLYTDSNFSTYQTNARAAGIKRGWYHFGSNGTQDAVTEADYFVTAVGAIQTGEIMVLDCETNSTDGRGPNVTWSKAFLDEVYTQVGFHPFIYMSQYVTTAFDWSSVVAANYHLWLADWNAISASYYAGAWSDAGRGYPIQQWSDNGSYSAIQNGVDTDAFFVPAGGTIDNWDSYGKPGSTPPPTPPTPGNNNTARVTNISNYSQTDVQSLITPTETHDQIIYSVTTSDGSLATGSHNGFYFIPTPMVNQRAYPIGIFSYDGGDSWNDFGYSLPATTTYAVIEPTVQIQAVSTASGISFNGVNGTGGTVNLIVKIALIAPLSPSPINTPAFLDQSLSYSNESEAIPNQEGGGGLLPPYASYRRISTDNSILSNSVDIAHNQSTIPNIMFWIDDPAHTYYTVNAIGWASNGTLGALGIRMDGTNVHFHVDNGTYGGCYYRIYKDN